MEAVVAILGRVIGDSRRLGSDCVFLADVGAGSACGWRRTIWVGGAGEERLGVSGRAEDVRRGADSVVCFGVDVLLAVTLVARFCRLASGFGVGMTRVAAAIVLGRDVTRARWFGTELGVRATWGCCCVLS